MTLVKKKLLPIIPKEYWALLGILLGAALVSFSLGPYSNWDSQTEYAAASSVIEYGVPFATYGNLINQPPIGFYINAFFLKVFGLSYATGVAVVTLFGVGCVFLVYAVGKTMYGGRTGLLAAGVFALMPWHVVLSRSFLIDVQCLFFSLLSLLIGTSAIRKGSLKLAFVTGLLFGIALLTKFFAVFTLIPLAMILAHHQRENLKTTLGEIALFALPPFAMYYLWYESISKLGFFSILGHTDFLNFNQGVTPSPLFLLQFLTWNLGPLFILALGVTVSLSLWGRERANSSFFDMVCLGTIIGTAGVNMFLVLAIGLWVPYVDPVKYDYQLLPAVCLLAASLLPKAHSFASYPSHKEKRNKLLLIFSLIGLILLASTILLNMRTLLLLTAQDNLLFSVNGDIGFSFARLSPIVDHQYLVPVQGLGFIFIALGLIWAGLSQAYDKTVPN